MEFPTVNGNQTLKQLASRTHGFTLIELLVVMTIIALLLAIASPRYWGATDRVKEAVLRENLSTLRDSIDKYYSDHRRYPDSLQNLVDGKYFRRIPEDPITESNTAWILVPPSDPSAGQIFDIHSGAPGRGQDGKLFREW